MIDPNWDAKLKSFLKKTGQDFKRFGTDVKKEAQKLMTDVQDPEKQRKLREGLAEVGDWAKKTAEELATAVESGVKKAETALRRPAPDAPPPPAPPPPRASAPKAAPPDADPTPPNAPARAPRKTVGKKKAAGGASKAKAPARKARKTIGKKPPSP